MSAIESLLTSARLFHRPVASWPSVSEHSQAGDPIRGRLASTRSESTCPIQGAEATKSSEPAGASAETDETPFSQPATQTAVPSAEANKEDSEENVRELPLTPETAPRPARAQPPTVPALPYQRAGHSPQGRDGTILIWVSGSGTGGVYVMNPDGTGLRLLSEGAVPTWSHDGQYIAYSQRGDAGYTDVFVMNPDGSQPRQLTPAEPGTNKSIPIWSPDGERLTYFTYPDAQVEIRVIDFDGSNEWVLLAGNPDECPGGLRWSPNGQSIAYVIHEYGGDKDTLCVRDAAGSSLPQKLVEARDISLFQFITWTPGTDRILFGMWEGGNKWGTYIMDPDGSNRMRILDDYPDVLELSPRATHFAYTCDFNCDPQGLSVMKSDGTDRRVLLPWIDDVDFHWSPDGTRLLVGIDLEHSQLHTMNVDGSRFRRITPDDSRNYGYASWVPWPTPL